MNAFDCKVTLLNSVRNVENFALKMNAIDHSQYLIYCMIGVNNLKKDLVEKIN